MTPKSTAIAACALPLALAACELGPKVSEQTGYRGTGMEQITDPDHAVKEAAIPAETYALPPDGGPTAAATYQNVPLLGGISRDRFDHFMAALNTWVVPADAPASEQGCNYCHNPENLASDEKYTKVVSRRMIQMTQAINAGWSSHVQQTGVTCWTCHRGEAIPANTWKLDVPSDPRSLAGNRRGQNMPDARVGWSSLPYGTAALYFQGAKAKDVRVASNSQHPSPNHVVPILDAEQTYGIMMRVSTALGVNCTYCHNTQSFRAWTQSSEARAKAWHGIRMVRTLNDDYLTPLASVFPAARKGPMGDTLKVNCATCHQGVNKPMGGVSMLAANPVLRGSVAAAPAPAPAAAPVAAVAGGSAVAGGAR